MTTESIDDLRWKRARLYDRERSASTALLNAQREHEAAVAELKRIDERIASAGPSPERASK